MSDAEADSGYPRLEQQIAWYDGRSKNAQRCYKAVKLIEVAGTAAIPVVAPFNGIAAAILGGFALFLEALQQLSQWHHNWIIYRSNCEALRHEKHLFLGGAGDYRDLAPEEARWLLVERTEALDLPSMRSGLPVSRAGQRGWRERLRKRPESGMG